MLTAQITHWQETGGKFFGFLNDSPDHWTQGEIFEDLRERLRDFHRMFSREIIPGIRRVEELTITS